MYERAYCVYILASKKNGVLYIGSTSDLAKRLWEHRNGLVEGFTKKYWVKRLVYFEVTDDPYVMVTRERRLKEWKREWKIALIEKMNPAWKDLSDQM